MGKILVGLIFLASGVVIADVGLSESERDFNGSSFVMARGRSSPSRSYARITAHQAIIEKLEIKRAECEDNGGVFTYGRIEFRSSGGRMVRYYTAVARYNCDQ